MNTFTAFFDANVFYSSVLTDFLMEIIKRNLFRAKWTNQVHDEWIEALLQKRPDLSRERLERRRDLMNQNTLDCLVTGYEDLIPNLNLPDSNDRHVLAAAIKAGAGVIVTKNLRDFPEQTLSKYGIEAQHPDMFVAHLMDLYPGEIVTAAKTCRRRLVNPPKDAHKYLESLQIQELTKTADALRQYVSVI